MADAARADHLDVADTSADLQARIRPRHGQPTTRRFFLRRTTVPEPLSGLLSLSGPGFWMAGKSFADHVRPAADDRPDLLAVDARDQELTWTQIGELLNTTAATAARRYRNKP